jgi:membrane-bound serine protease (ClpP class)
VTRHLRLVFLLACLGGLGAVGLRPAHAVPAFEIPELRLSGVVDPFVASYVRDGISQANRDGNPAVLLTIDTPGGLDSAMRDIVKAISNSDVPVICYTAPPGARAASAGAFIVLSCPVAAMAPGTNIGAAHPVGIAGAIEQDKVTNDAAAFIRALAERWDRNADWAEDAVRDSVSVSAEEAVRIRVVDLLAPDRDALLSDVGGCGPRAGAAPSTGLLARSRPLPGICQAAVHARSLGLGPAILHRLLDPNLAFIFFYLGLSLIIAEIFVPGGVVGTAGAVLLVLAVVALGMLPVQLLGVVLLVASVAFFLLEIKLPGTWVGTGAGLVTLVLGGLFLFDRSVPGAAVSPAVIAPVAIAAAAFFTFVLRAAIRMRRQRPASALHPSLGAEGTVIRTLDPTGVVLLAAEEWSAQSTGVTIPKGERVRVTEVEGLRLKVEPVEGSMENAGPGPPGQAQPAAAQPGGERGTT